MRGLKLMSIRKYKYILLIGFFQFFRCYLSCYVLVGYFLVMKKKNWK